MALAIVGQADFGAGIYRGREAPENAAYDLLNLLIDDEGQPYRRGGSAYKSTADAGLTLVGLRIVRIPGGAQRIVAWPASGTDMYALSDVDAPVTLATTAASAPPAFSRSASYGPLEVFRVATATSDDYILYAGSLKPSYSVTATITAGSRTITGTGFTANVDPGMLIPNGSFLIGVVETVNSDTSLTLVENWVGSTGTFPGLVFQPMVKGDWRTGEASQYSALIARPLTNPVAIAGVAGRVAVCKENVISFSPRYGSHTEAGLNMDARSDFDHELPREIRIIGAEPIGQDTLLVFTTSGAWAIDNLDFDPIDDVGNIQHTVREINELILLNDSGIAKWRGAVLAPCIDNIYLIPLGAEPIPIADALGPLYRSYVQAGYRPGAAAVHRGHYFLPILNGTTLVDELICRLDQDFAWTRWSGHAASGAYIQRIGSTTSSPQLFGVAGQRVIDLSNTFNPSVSNASEANASVHPILIDTRDYPTPAGRLGSTTKQVRARYEATAAGAVSVTAKFSRGPEGSSYTSLANLRGGAAADGLDESVWSVIRKAPAIRFRIESASALSTFTLRSIEARYTQSGVP